MSFERFTDKELVEGILKGDEAVIAYFFYKKCRPMLLYAAWSVFDGKMEMNELVSELYLYLSEWNWYKVRKFDFRSRLTTWTGVVAIRFFQKKRASLIKNRQSEPLDERFAPLANPYVAMDRRLDVQEALRKMPNARYRKVVECLDLQEWEPEQLAKEMEITVDNLYNVHRRALLQLRMVMSRKEDYYG